MNAELSNILQQRILLNKIDNALAYYALTHLSHVRHTKRIQLSRCLCNIVHMYVGIGCGVWQAQSVSCWLDIYVAHVKMLSGTSRQQVSSPNFGRKKTPDLSVRGLSFI
jgi:hypothetical protein